MQTRVLNLSFIITIALIDMVVWTIVNFTDTDKLNNFIFSFRSIRGITMPKRLVYFKVIPKNILLYEKPYSYPCQILLDFFNLSMIVLNHFRNSNFQHKMKKGQCLKLCQKITTENDKTKQPRLQSRLN